MASDDKKNILNWADKDGSFNRKPSAFRNWIKSDPNAEFPAESGRYHLYVSYACPWAHRALIVRNLKGLDQHITFTSVHYEMLEKGWRFPEKNESIPGENCTPDPLPGHEDYTHLRHIYFAENPDYEGRFTVPCLFDKKQGRIVSNESSEIIRMFDSAFDGVEGVKKDVDLLPKELEGKIDEVNAWIYDDVNNGVYKSGFATTQEAYEKAVKTLFKSLDRVETDLEASKGAFYFGDRLTEADVRLYTTIIRFDAVYVQHFKCNIRDIRSGYPNLHKWVRNLYWNHPAFGSTTQFEHIKKHYTKSHKQINPFSITPVGPDVDILPLDEEMPVVKAALKK